MSMEPVTPSKFNPVLGSAMVGMAAAVGATGTVARRLSDYFWIKNSLQRNCELILRLAEDTRDRTRALAKTMTRNELHRARASLLGLAEEVHACFRENFEPTRFRQTVLAELPNGNSPETIAMLWVREIVAPIFDLLNRVQAVRMKGQQQEWLALERFKQDLVNCWGQHGFEVSRWHGREHSYLLRSALKTLVKCLAYPLLAAAIAAGSFYLAVVFEVGM